MRATHPLTIATAFFASLLPATAAEPQWLSAEAEGESAEAEFALEGVSLNLIDQKVAVSLAVEAQVQIDLTEHALPKIHNSRLRRLTERKLALYRALFETLDDLSDGRARSMLARVEADRARRRPASDTLSTSEPSQVQTSATTTTAQIVDSRDKATEATPAVIATKATRAKTSGSKGGLSGVLENATANAILRVRLDIAETYHQMLRAELAAVAPADFDRHYLHTETVNQMQVLAMLRVFEQQASPEFARVLHQATLAAERHTVELKAVAESAQRTDAPVAAPSPMSAAQSGS